ncbi:hypothetical protein F511_14112 [Dorcoceras hygrometricum]|uniref:Uncharacterized protein n=1 Tax=Dorcoceras hygrometricum TaxID=472368 RepID=A0A2Z7B3C2_9LAMI|nr:hypothetical protein F511_14112 [Dorcoceras hygrometricum]
MASGIFVSAVGCYATAGWDFSSATSGFVGGHFNKIEAAARLSFSGEFPLIRPPFVMFEVALDSSLEALSIDSPFGGCSGLERNLEATVFLPCGCAFRAPLTVREYARTLSSLLAYVPHVSGRERARRTRFLEGLNEELYQMVLTSKPKTYAEVVDSAIDIEEGLRSRRSRRQQVALGGRSTGQGAQSSQASQSAHQPQQQQQKPQQQVAQQSGRQRFRPRGITDSACKNQLVVVSVQYGPFNPYIPIRSTTIGKSRVAKDPIAMHTIWRSNSDITSVTRVFRQLPCWRLGAWLRPVSRGNRHFTVGGGRLRQSGPRSEGRLLRQPALEGLTRSAWTKTPRKVGRNKFRRGAATAAAQRGGGGGDLGEEGGVCF